MRQNLAQTMPPKRAAKKAAKKDGSSGGGGKKGKKKAKAPEGPVPWKLTKERLAQLTALKAPAIKEQVCFSRRFALSLKSALLLRLCLSRSLVRNAIFLKRGMPCGSRWPRIYLSPSDGTPTPHSRNVFQVYYQGMAITVQHPNTYAIDSSWHLACVCTCMGHTRPMIINDDN